MIFHNRITDKFVYKFENELTVFCVVNIHMFINVILLSSNINKHI